MALGLVLAGGAASVVTAYVTQRHNASQRNDVNEAVSQDQIAPQPGLLPTQAPVRIAPESAKDRDARQDYVKQHLADADETELVESLREALRKPASGAELAIACFRLGDFVAFNNDPGARERCEALAGELLAGYDDGSRLAGAVLCGLTGVTPSRIVGPIDRLSRQQPPLTLERIQRHNDAQLAELGLRRVDALRYALQTEDKAMLQQVLRIALRLRDRAQQPNSDDLGVMPAAPAALARLPQGLRPLAWAAWVRLDPYSGWACAFPRAGPAVMDREALTRSDAGAALLEHLTAGRAPTIDASSADRTQQLQRLADWTRLHRRHSVGAHDDDRPEPTRPDPDPGP
ncbi:MAG: hypothetical protein AAGA57_00560 [Planctomycetota bacterium]